MSKPNETDRIRKALADLTQSVAELMIDNAIVFDEDDDTGELAMRGMLNNACDALGWARKVLPRGEDRIEHGYETTSGEKQVADVVIEVSGGVADVTKCPRCITCKIIDYDDMRENELSEMRARRPARKDDTR